MGPDPRPLIEKALREAGVETKLGVGVVGAERAQHHAERRAVYRERDRGLGGRLPASPLTAQIPAERDRSGR
jgi:NADH dehydrogenase